MAQIILVTDLGPGNEGTIAPDSRIPADILQRSIENLANPEYRKPPTRRWRCVDGRVGEGGLTSPEGFADPQMPGGLVIVEVSVDLMTETLQEDDRLSTHVARNTRLAIKSKQEIFVHGDNHVEHLPLNADGDRPETNKGGCLANAKQREILILNHKRKEIVTPIAAKVAQVAGLGQYFTSDSGVPDEEMLSQEVDNQIDRGFQVAGRDEFWDKTPEEVVDIILENGGAYEELIEDHAEVVGLVNLTDEAFHEEKFMKDHVVTLDDGAEITLEAFVASLRLYIKYQFERAESERRPEPEVWAARRGVAAILKIIGTVKKATKDGFVVALVAA